MNCPKCGSEMRREGLASLSGESVIITFECPNCHYRTEKPAQKLASGKPLHLR